MNTDKIGPGPQRDGHYPETALLADLRQLEAMVPNPGAQRAFRESVAGALRAEIAREHRTIWPWRVPVKAIALAAAAMLLMSAMLYRAPVPVAPAPPEAVETVPVAKPVPMAGGRRGGQPVRAPLIRLETSNPNVVIYWVNASEEEEHV